MKKILAIMLVAVIGVALTVAFVGCNPKIVEPECTSWKPTVPADSATVKVGDVVNVTWCVPDTTKAKISIVEVKLTMGKNTVSISKDPIPVATTSFSWSVTADQVGVNNKITIFAYGNTKIFSESVTFTVIP